MFQCAPNLSEGRNPRLFEALRESLGRCSGVALADISMDPDHNRMVVSLLGGGEGLVEAVLRLFEIATASIDLSQHSGVHPRVGAVDVVPFVPLGSSTLAEAADWATRCAELVAERFEIPVLLYENSARSPERVGLPDLRRGGLVGLAERLALAPPDFGPPGLHPRWGATIMGARRPLIAFNVVLAGGTVEAARLIARSLRGSSGGYPSVRALGFWLEHQQRAQVSINLTNPEEVDLWDVFQRVTELAREMGLEIESSELIGMAPASSFVRIARDQLKMPALHPGQLLEWNLLHHQENLEDPC